MDVFNSVLANISSWEIRDWLALCATLFSLWALVVSSKALRRASSVAETVSQNLGKISREKFKRELKDSQLVLYQMVQLAKSVFDPWKSMSGDGGEIGTSMRKTKGRIKKVQEEHARLAQLNLEDYDYDEIEEMVTRINDMNASLRRDEEDLKNFEQWAADKPIPTR